MIKPQQFRARGAGLRLGISIVVSPDEEAAPRTFRSLIRQRHDSHDGRGRPGVPDQRAATLVRIRLGGVTANGIEDLTSDPQSAHESCSIQNRSDT